MDRLRPHELREDIDRLLERTERHERLILRQRKVHRTLRDRVGRLKQVVERMAAVLDRTDEWALGTKLKVGPRPRELVKYLSRRREQNVRALRGEA